MKLVLMEYVKDNLPSGFQPYYIYSMMVENVEVGRLTLREGTDEERYFDGHIGYSVFDAFRGHNYAYQACIELKGILKCDHLIITCDPHNKVSQHIIEKLGCQYMETKVIPQKLRKWFTSEEKEKMIYKWIISK